MKDKILITGSCGFVMGNFIRKVIYDKNPYIISSIDKVGENDNGLYWNKNHSFHIADLSNKHIIETIIKYEQPNIIIHGASETNENFLYQNPNTIADNNLKSTQNLLEACKKFNIKKFVYISSDQVYDDHFQTICNENSILNPKTLLGTSKAICETLVKSYSSMYGIEYTILRPCNMYGPRQSKFSTIPKAVKSILDKTDLVIDQVENKDWLYVGDFAEALLKTLDKWQPNSIYNISGDQEYNDLEISQKICNLLEDTSKKITCLSETDKKIILDSIKIKSLGWKPTNRLKNDLFDTVNWFKNNMWFLR